MPLSFLPKTLQAHIDELIPYNNQELYDRNVRNFSQSYAYALLHGSQLRQLRSNNQSSNASLKTQQQPVYLNDQNNKFNLRLFNKRRRRSAMTLGLRIVLSKEHFQVKIVLFFCFKFSSFKRSS